MEHTATFSPEDNKIRIYPAYRLDKETYTRVRNAGYIWAPKQELFVAPMWTPEREDLALELCGEIGDEDKSLVERQEERAERFSDYSDNRAQDADRAHAAVHAIADMIPLGQPILIGHHSERRARKDAERIQNGMRKAVKMWETAEYWKYRAAGAIRLAKYKERPDVRARRIKGLETDERKFHKTITDNELLVGEWRRVSTLEQAKRLANYSHISKCFTLAEYPRDASISQYEGEMSIWSALDRGIINEIQAREIVIPAYERGTARAARWLQHTENRLAYERAMLADSGGLVADNEELEIGGRVLVRGEWVTITKLNKKDGKIVSVTTNARYCRVKSIEEIKEYEAPSQEQAAATQAAVKLPTLCNYPGDRFATCTQAEWDAIHKDWKGIKYFIEATDTTERHRVRQALGNRVHLPPPAGKELEPHYCSANRTHTWWPVFITDAKRKDPPAAKLIPEPEPVLPLAPMPDLGAITERAAAAIERRAAESGPNKFEQMKQTLKAGVQVVSAPQLFPTPPELAARMVEVAEIETGHRVLEPSAGTGNILRAIGSSPDKVAVEINPRLVELLARAGASGVRVHEADFLQCNGDLGTFDRILMNPPFANGDDIRHIMHARHMLKPGGRLVAICANGPRQNEQLKPLAASWEDLPDGTFKEQGTGVRTALLVIEG